MIGITHMEILSGSATIVKVEGPLNGQTSFDFEDYINRLIDKKIYYVLFDAKELDYISSEGIGVLLLVQQKISELNGYLVFFNLSEELVSLFTILGFDNVFKIAESRIQAIQVMDRQIELREMNDDLSGTQKVAYQLHAEQLDVDDDSAESESSESTEQNKVPENKIVEAYVTENKDKSQIKLKQQKPAETLQAEKNEEHLKEAKINDEEDILVIDDADLFKQENQEHISSTIEKNETEPVVTHSHETRQHVSKKEEHLHYTIDASRGAYQQPLIVECKKCKSLVRVREPGEYLCPDCRTIFTARKDQTVVFDLKE